MKSKSDSFLSFRKHIESFVKLTDDEFSGILEYFSLKKVKKKTHLVKAGGKVNSTFWIIKGLVASNYADSKGKEHVIQVARENCWVTDQNAFYNQALAELDIVCMQDSELLSITYEDREQLCDDFHKMANFFRKKANDSFVKQQKRMLTYLTADAQKRYDMLMSDDPEMFRRFSKKTLAAYLGVSRETLSRFGKS